MIEELFINDSPIQRLDPRVKIVIVFLFSVLIAASNRFTVLGAAFAAGCWIVVITRVPFKLLVKRLLPVNILIIFLWFFLPFTYGGESVLSVGSLSATREGIWYAARITVKSNAMMLILIALVASTSVFTIGHAMHAIGVPQKIVHLFFFTYRYIHVIYKEYNRLLNAMKIRGFTPRTNLHTYKTVAYMVGMLLVKSADRAQRVHHAMLCRGFIGNFYSLTEFSVKKADVAALVLMVSVILILGVLEWSIMI